MAHEANILYERLRAGSHDADYPSSHAKSAAVLPRRRLAEGPATVSNRIWKLAPNQVVDRLYIVEGGGNGL